MPRLKKPLQKPFTRGADCTLKLQAGDAEALTESVMHTLDSLEPHSGLHPNAGCGGG